jgi:fimbrial chaperone protein
VSQLVRLILLLSAMLTLIPAPVHAGAVLFIYPTHIIFEGNQRSAEITLTNRGDAIGTFETSWSDMVMTPEGGLVRHDGQSPWSIQPYVRYSPRRVTLDPGASQVIKIALRRSQEVAEGEYFSHFKVLILNSEDLDEAESGSSESAAAIRIQARTAIAVPIIWRNSREVPSASIEAVRVDTEINELVVDIKRQGALSVRGFLHVFSTAPDGTRTPLAEPAALIIYPGLENRTVNIRLNEGIRADDLPRHSDIFYTPDSDVTDKSIVYSSHALRP